MNPAAWYVVISVVVLGFDIVWQFLVAGYYGPRMARRLILQDPKFSLLETQVKRLSKRTKHIDSLRDEMQKHLSSEISKLQAQLDSICQSNGNVKSDTKALFDEFSKEYDHKIEDMRKSIVGTITGTLGQYAQAPNVSQGLPPELQGVEVSMNETMQQADFDLAYGMLVPVIGEERAYPVAYYYAVAPPLIKKAVMKRIEKIVKGR